MSIPSKERFLDTTLRVNLQRSSKMPFESFDYDYTFQDKDKRHRKELRLTILGGSQHKDLLPEKGGENLKQYVCCDEAGELYEALVAERKGHHQVVALRSDRVDKEKEKKPEIPEGVEFLEPKKEDD